MAEAESKPSTPFRGDHEIFGTLIADHDVHRDLLARLGATRGDCAQRRELFEELTYELKAHAAAEEQAVWSTVLRKPEITEEGRHAVAEHKEIDDILNSLAARDMGSGAWLVQFGKLREAYLHHIREEEQEIFIEIAECFDETDRAYMKSVYQRRKPIEKQEAEITPRLVPAD